MQRDAADVNTFGKYVAGIAGSVLAGTALFVLSFVALDFVWAYFVVTQPKQINLGDGVVGVGGGFLIGCTLGIAAALVLVLYRFWPGRSSK